VTNISRWNKGRFDHIAHKEVTDPFGIFTVSFISFLWFGVFGVCDNDRNVCLLQDIKYRDPILTGRLHTDFRTIVLCEPITQFTQPFRKGRETSLLVVGSAICISHSNAGIDPGFVDIKSATVFTKDFKRQ
jgi:hypothetical protein